VIGIVEYGCGNLASLENALDVLGFPHQRVITPQALASSERLILPGVGHFGHAMSNLRSRGLVEALQAWDRPLLGICLGMQLLFEGSAEAPEMPGLGLLPGRFEAFSDPALKVPHMGWNNVRQAMPHPLWTGIEDGARFYFVHSYFVAPVDASCVVGTTDYGLPFTSAVARDNIFAIQCHPEKSALAGLAMLGNFVAWKP